MTWRIILSLFAIAVASLLGQTSPPVNLNPAVQRHAVRYGFCCQQFPTAAHFTIVVITAVFTSG